MYDITILQIYNYFFKSSSSFDEIGKGGRITPFSFELPRLYLNEFGLYSSIFGSKLEFRVLYKGGSKMDPPFGSFENEWNETDPLIES